MTFDAAIASVVLFGGRDASGTAVNDTWEFAGGVWSNLTRTLPVAPSPRWGASLAYDGVDGYAVLFGGRNATAFFNDTWEFNGTNWIRLTPTSAPLPRSAGLFAYDSVDHYVLLFGGQVTSGGSPVNDTWSYAGGNWTNLTGSSPSPSPAWGAGMAFDDADGAMVYFGGSSTGPPGCIPVSSSTWTFSSGNWTNRSPVLPTAPPGVVGPAGMAYDPASESVLVFSGIGAVGFFCQATPELWAYHLGNWTNLTPFFAAGPSPRFGAGFAGDPAINGTLLFGGNTSWGAGISAVRNDTWTLDIGPGVRAAWSVEPRSALPSESVRAQVTPYLGDPPYGITWNFGDGSPNGSTPSVTHAYASVGRYDLNVSVLDAHGSWANFSRSLVVANGTWTNLTNWSIAPPARTRAAMAYDPGANAVLLYGGEDSAQFPLGDTWEFQDGNWTQILTPPASSPPPVFGAAMVYDSTDRTLLLFGGTDGAYPNNWTFEFNTSSDLWVQVASTSAPSPRTGSVVFDDPADGGVVLYGGECPGCGTLGRDLIDQDTWIFAGGSWSNVTSTVFGRPPKLVFAGGADDVADGYGLIYGGSSGGCPGESLTWAFSSGTWTNLTATAGQPPSSASGASALAYDPSLDGIVAFGGSVSPSSGAGCTTTNSTWLFRGGGWSNLTAGSNLSADFSTPPSARTFGALAYDDANGMLVLFGGNVSASSSQGAVADTWTFPGFPEQMRATAVPSAGDAPLVVNFSATIYGGSAPYRTAWAFGDGSPNATNLSVTHRYPAGGTFVAVVTVIDAHGRVARLLVVVAIQAHLAVTAGTTARVVERPYGIGFRAHVSGGLGPYSYVWGFGDGQSTTMANPNHYYALAGNYTASLTVRDAFHQVNVSLVGVTVLPALSASAMVAPLWGDAPLVIHANASSFGGSAPYTTSWNFGDKSNLVSGASAVHTYLVAGAFALTFNVTDSLNYTVLVHANVLVEPPLSVSVLASPSNGLAPLPVSVSAVLAGGTLPYNQTWSFGDGTYVYGAPTATHTYPRAGSFTVRFTVVDATGAAVNGSTRIDVVEPLSVDPNASGREGAVPFTVAFRAGDVGGLAPYNYSWGFADGSPGAFVEDPSHTFTEIGSHRVTLDVVDSLGEVASSSIMVVVVTPLVARLSADASAVAVGANVTFSTTTNGGALPLRFHWSGLPAGCSGPDAPTFSCTVGESGTFTIHVTVSDTVNETVVALTNLTVTAASSPTSSGIPGGYVTVALGAAVIVVVIALLLVRARRRTRTGRSNAVPPDPADEVAPESAEVGPPPEEDG